MVTRTTQILIIMKNTIIYNVALGCIITFFSYSLSAQSTKISNSNSSDVYLTHTRVSNYLELKKLGYAEKEIYEDLGNANFLSKNYDTALFWYKKLIQISEDGALSSNYHRRYQFALEQTDSTKKSRLADDKDWLAMVKADYEINKEKTSDNSLTDTFGEFGAQRQFGRLQYNPLPNENRDISFEVEMLNGQKAYKTPITVTANGNIAFFSKTVYVKPPHGIFAKKEQFHKIYKAEKVDGQWKNIKEVALCPKYYSALHPAISDDGKRLFFASDMPGTLGKYDIYVSTMQKDGTFGIAKNLGEKVNTKKNDLYPNIVDGNTLFFASDGRKGKGGLDVFMVQVEHKKVGLAVNLGSPINSKEDDFSIRFMNKDGMGYVISNRGKSQGALDQVAFSVNTKMENKFDDQRAYSVVEALSNDLKTDYSSSVFEDE